MRKAIVGLFLAIPIVAAAISLAVLYRADADASRGRNGQ